MKVKVTQEDIEVGRLAAAKTCGCPIWQALCRTLGVDEIRVDTVRMATLGKVRIPLPDSARKFQNKLLKNRNSKVSPFIFETELVEPK